MFEYTGQTTNTETITLGSINIPLGQARVLRATWRGTADNLACGGILSVLAKNANGTVSIVGSFGGVAVTEGGLAVTFDLVANSSGVSVTALGTAGTLVNWTALVEVL